jgi:hypothetical protein
MRTSWRWLARGSILLPALAACNNGTTGLDFGDGGGDDGTTGSSSGGGGGSGGSSSGPGFGGDSSTLSGGDNNSDCKGGYYEGQFGGLYSSSLTIFGINIPVTGDVQMTLQQMGSGQQMCVFEGESENCSDVFSVQNGSISGTADAIHTADASFLGFPYYCSLTGTLGCMEKKLVGGWIECTYCVGPLADGGKSCELIGGHFSGPLTADYQYHSATDAGPAGSGPPMFGTLPPPFGNDPGAWNGAESLAGYSGMGPLPDGGNLSDYLSDAGYGMIGAKNDFGGYGWWYATYQHP